MFLLLRLLCSLLQTSVQVPSPAAGVIEELLVPDGGKVEGGTPLFTLRKGGRFQEALGSLFADVFRVFNVHLLVPQLLPRLLLPQLQDL